MVDGPIPNFQDALARLRFDANALPWDQRRRIARALARPLMAHDHNDILLPLARILAHDPKWEVRKSIAECLAVLPPDDASQLGAALSADKNAFVCKIAERALARRKHSPRRCAMLPQDVHVAAYQQFDLMIRSALHNMRGVLSPLKHGVTELLAQQQAGAINAASAGQYLPDMVGSLAFFERVCNDMRTYSGIVHRECRRESVAQIAQEALKLAREELQARGENAAQVSVTLQVPDSLTFSVTRHQIVLAIANLLKNAMDSLDKTHPGNREVSLTAKAVGQMVEVVIEDEGIGIPRENLRKLRTFAPGRWSTKHNRGTGYGLPIAHRCAVIHGGDLTIYSIEGDGTRVTFSIPVEENSACGSW